MCRNAHWFLTRSLKRSMTCSRQVPHLSLSPPPSSHPSSLALVLVALAILAILAALAALATLMSSANHIRFNQTLSDSTTTYPATANAHWTQTTLSPGTHAALIREHASPNRASASPTSPLTMAFLAGGSSPFSPSPILTRALIGPLADVGKIKRPWYELEDVDGGVLRESAILGKRQASPSPPSSPIEANKRLRFELSGTPQPTSVIHRNLRSPRAGFSANATTVGRHTMDASSLTWLR
ncbi:hypothetical protein EXIGLDRAFT_383345 [Exidia glandulosa HHB12029]|uniref:Uncharacterized protein n=1 Tax=Exidia glandulosa HHB12029 TaxID=1314781 RepID=A0A166B283_EXIGL|nr:hypothetical protein EXIGLDRAFT_383345 [Exidia glandulosa HHB12029]